MKLLPAKEKKERALGSRLGLKPFRSQSPKAAMTRRPYRPGVHGAKRSRAASEFKLQLSEKQKMKLLYGLNERQLKKIFTKALSNKKEPILQSILDQLEFRLDSVVYRAGFSPSRIMARQAISHGHITLNGKKITFASSQARVGDIVAIRKESASSILFKELPTILKAVKGPWFSVNPQDLSVEITGRPRDIELPFNINLIVDYYAR
jgi:small subunit ribosomal protein S4